MAVNGWQTIEFRDGSPSQCGHSDARPARPMRNRVVPNESDRNRTGPSRARTVVRRLRRRPTHEVDVPEVAGAAVGIDHEAEGVRTGTNWNARDGDRHPRLPTTGVRHHNGTRHGDAVNFYMRGAAGPC